ncbi:L-threonylcarbamoyladenylate synthase [Dyella sp.]|uniref:L-threonylcarbamoyladenylate synthase n=1 Tax=Dyella sp. TaxID=1869338 RepID=UPI002D77B871|nr:Sua5/YciO/YrdC/YwlC family protein [Dyella sp.]HET6430600.1 Sua5/YciO/YrdC/YwlC family protein [Dyella sp.]
MLHRYGASETEGAAALLRAGGVLAYPDESFVLGCDPQDLAAFERVRALKQRPAELGMLLIAGEFAQLERYLALDGLPEARLREVLASWPGASVWVMPRSAAAPSWLVGAQEGVAVCVTACEPAAALCQAFGGAIASTSANPHGQAPARTPQEVIAYFGEALDGLLAAPLAGDGPPATIRDALSGAIIRC